MIVRLFSGFLLKPVFMAIAFLLFAVGAFAVTEQEVAFLGDDLTYQGRDAVLFGASLAMGGVACFILYVATWVFTMPLAVVSTVLLVSAFGLTSIDSVVSPEVMDVYLLNPVSSAAEQYAKPVIDSTVKPILEIVASFQS